MVPLKSLLQKWWLYLAVGFLSLFLGIRILSYPGLGFEISRIFLVIEFLKAGILITAGVLAFREYIVSWGWELLLGLLVLFAGILLAINPGLSSSFMLWLYSAGILCEGFANVALSILFRKNGLPGWGWMMALGILSIFISLLLIANPLLAILSIDILAAFGLILFGISLFFLALSMRRIVREMESF